VDTGSIVFNARNYPNFERRLTSAGATERRRDELGVTRSAREGTLGSR
jgi:hypothetical protein